MIKGSVQEEDLRIVNIYASKIGAPQYIRQVLASIQVKIDSNTIVVGDFKPHFYQWRDHQDRKSKSKYKP